MKSSWYSRLAGGPNSKKSHGSINSHARMLGSASGVLEISEIVERPQL